MKLTFSTNKFAKTIMIHPNRLATIHQRHRQMDRQTGQTG